MKLTLHMDDYVTAMGGVGLIRLLNWAHQHLDNVPPYDAANSLIQQQHDHLIVDASILPHIPEWFFRCLLDQYSISNREEKQLQSIGHTKENRNGDNLKTQQDRLKTSIQYQTQKLIKYFPNAPELAELQECLEQVKSVRGNEDDSTSLAQLKNRYLKLLGTPAFEEKLTFNIIRSILNNQFFGQVSFLQKSMSSYNLKQHIDRMTADYINPLLFECKTHELLHGSLSASEKYEQLIAHLSESDSSLHKRWARELKKLEPEMVENYFQQELKCSFEEQWLATDQLEEKVFVPLGVSSSNAYNFSWDLQHHPTPISSWIRLVLFLSPIGLTPFTRIYNDQFETFYSFIYRDGWPYQVYSDNEVLRNLEQNESFDRLIPKILARDQHKAKQEAKADIQIVEFYSDIDKKKTVMNYFHIPRHMIAYFKDDKLQKMRLIWDRSLRDPFLRLVMESIDPIETVWAFLRKAIRGKAQAGSAVNALKERWKISRLKEGEKMINTYVIEQAYREGTKIRRKLGTISEQRQTQTEYVSGGEKRAAGIAHRLLNAAQANNKHQFMDTVIRLYLQVGEAVPAILLQVLKEEKTDFASYSGAFITGLLSNDSRSKPEDSADEEESSASNPA